MKIQINSLEALERLLGGDTTVEIELRGAIVQEFAKKHLKAVAKSEEVLKAITATQREIVTTAQAQLNSAMATFNQSYLGHIHDLKLRPEIQAEIKRQVDSLVSSKLNVAVQTAIVEKLNDTEMVKEMDRRFEYYTSAIIRQRIEAKLDELKASLKP